MNIFELCEKEDIDGLNKFKDRLGNFWNFECDTYYSDNDNNSDYIDQYIKEKALEVSITKGKYESVKWLCENIDIDIDKDYIVRLSIIKKKYHITKWLYNYYKIKQFKLKSLSPKNINIQKIFKEIEKKEICIKNEFIELCKRGKMKDIHELYNSNKNIIDNTLIHNTLSNIFTFESIKWGIQNNLCNTNFLFEKSIVDDNVYIFKCIYVYAKIKIHTNKIFEETINKLDKNKYVYKAAMKYISSEKKYNKLLKLCKKEDISKVELYYLNNLEEIANQITIRSYNDILHSSKNNIKVFNWFINLYNINNDKLKLYLIDAIQNVNLDLLLYCKKILYAKDLKTLNIAKCLVNCIDVNSSILFVLNNKIKIYDNLDDLLNLLIINLETELFKRIVYEYNYFNDPVNVIKFIMQACSNSSFDFIKWLYSFNQKIFDDECSIIYSASVFLCFTNSNYDALKWLIGFHNRFIISYNSTGEKLRLYDQYEYAEMRIDDDDSDFSDDSYYNKLYTKVLKNINNAYKLLNITKTYVNTNNENCIICKDTPDDLLQLNCNHYACLTCLATWFEKTEEQCTYCNTDINWKQCKKLKK